jgi:hypothetical protein
LHPNSRRRLHRRSSFWDRKLLLSSSRQNKINSIAAGGRELLVG